MTQTIEQTLDGAMSMTRQMLSSAKQGEWQKVADLQAQRQKSLTSTLQASANIDSQSSNGVRIQKLIELDQEVQLLVKSARDSVRDELLQINKVRTAAKAYSSSE